MAEREYGRHIGRGVEQERLSGRWPLQVADDVPRGDDGLVQQLAYSLHFLRPKRERSGLTLGGDAEVQAHRDKRIQEIVQAASSRVSMMRPIRC